MNKDFYGIVRSIKNDSNNLLKKTKQLFNIINEDESLNLEEMQELSYYLKDLPSDSKTELIRLFSKHNLFKKSKFVFLYYISSGYDFEQQIKDIRKEKSNLANSFKSPADMFSKKTKEKTVKFGDMLEGLKYLSSIDFEKWIVEQFKIEEKYDRYKNKKTMSKEELLVFLRKLQTMEYSKFKLSISYLDESLEKYGYGNMYFEFENGISFDGYKIQSHQIKVNIDGYNGIKVFIDFSTNLRKLERLHLITLVPFNVDQLKDVLTGKFFRNHFYEYICEVMNDQDMIFKRLMYKLEVSKSKDSKVIEVELKDTRGFARNWLIVHDVDIGYFKLYAGKEKKLVLSTTHFLEVLSYLICLKY